MCLVDDMPPSGDREDGLEAAEARIDSRPPQAFIMIIDVPQGHLVFGGAVFPGHSVFVGHIGLEDIPAMVPRCT